MEGRVKFPPDSCQGCEFPVCYPDDRICDECRKMRWQALPRHKKALSRLSELPCYIAAVLGILFVLGPAIVAGVLTLGVASIAWGTDKVL
ncbi:hypothetical protein KKD19_07135 [Patescibacteria group bacterium]|nr:hypothetical protein [Patescibacteria group bacterium]MBU4512978.1 hypothetical protein [Patescibacteria group bacterium]MCG2693014.1 hypothetical protein [Candidatus Parcubacteria bacterium]